MSGLATLLLLLGHVTLGMLVRAVPFKSCFFFGGGGGTEDFLRGGG